MVWWKHRKNVEFRDAKLFSVSPAESQKECPFLIMHTPGFFAREYRHYLRLWETRLPRFKSQPHHFNSFPTLGTFLYLCGPHFSYLWNVDNNYTHLVGHMWEHTVSVCKSIMQYLAQRKCLRNHSQYFSFLSIIWSQVYHVSSHPQSQHTLYTCPLHFDIPAVNFCYLVGLRQRLWRVVLGETTCCDSSQYMKQTRFGWSQNIGDLMLFFFFFWSR